VFSQNDIGLVIRIARTFYTYIMASKTRVLYIGMTNDLFRRVWEHKRHLLKGFTKRFNVTRLVWYDETDDVTAAIELEKGLKGWLRKKKVALIEENNPNWLDLAAEWYE